MSTASGSAVWAAAPGSGLNADKTDGYHISIAATGSDPNTIYFRT